MPYKERIIEKKYFAIGEVATLFKVAPSLIRYWEGEFDIIRPKKDKKGNRRYTKEDIEQIRYVYHLVKEKGFTLDGARDVIARGSEKGLDKVVAIQQLEEMREFFETLLKEINEKPTP